MSSDSDPAPPPDPSGSALPDSLGGVADLLDIRIVEANPERVRATMPVTPRHHQPFGVLHGGVSVVLAESVASVGAFLAAPDDRTAVGIEVNANHVRSVEDGTVVAAGTPLHTGRSTHVWDVKLRHEDRLICVSRCTLAIVEQSSSS